MRSGSEPESQTPCSIGLVVIKSMQVKAREQAPLLCSGSAFNNIAKKTRRVKCAFLGPFHTVRPPKHTGA